MTQLLNSYDNRPVALTMAGSAGMTFGGFGALTDTEFAGVARMVFGGVGDLRIGKVMAGVSAMRFGATGVAQAGVVPMVGTAGMTFGSEATLKRVGKLQGTAGMTFGGGATLRKGVQMAGTANMTFGQAGTLKKAKQPTGSAGMTFGGTASMEFPTIVPDVWWTMDEASGTRYDSTPTNCDLTDHGDNVTTSAGVVGDAARVGDYSYYLEKTSGVPIHNHDWTWFGWVKANDDVVTDVVVGNPLYIAATGYDLMLVFATGTGWQFQKTTAGPVVETITYGTPPPIGAWQFWALSYDHSEKRVKLYLDAELVAEEVWDNAIPASTDDYFAVTIGQNGGSSDTHLVDNMGRCPRVLSPAEIAILYGYGGGVEYSEL